VELEGVFVQIGLVPNTEWLKGTLALSAWRDRDRCQGPDLDAGRVRAGDVTTVPYKQIVIAVGEGARRLSAFDHLIRSSADDVAPAARKRLRPD
jgi:alkyl hydroperoxide reductase subunit F